MNSFTPLSLDDDYASEQNSGTTNSDQQSGFRPISHDEQAVVDTREELGQNRSPQMKKNLKLYGLIGLLAIAAGIGTGYGGFALRSQGSSLSPRVTQDIQQVAGEQIGVGDVFGVDDQDTFRDNAQGYLEAGGINGEGSHRLLRPGGEDQTVYLTSSITDLDPLVGMEVKVYGETFKGQKAGWLMDVGRVEVVKLNLQKPE